MNKLTKLLKAIFNFLSPEQVDYQPIGKVNTDKPPKGGSGIQPNKSFKITVNIRNVYKGRPSVCDEFECDSPAEGL